MVAPTLEYLCNSCHQKQLLRWTPQFLAETFRFEYDGYDYVKKYKGEKESLEDVSSD